MSYTNTSSADRRRSTSPYYPNKRPEIRPYVNRHSLTLVAFGKTIPMPMPNPMIPPQSPEEVKMLIIERMKRTLERQRKREIKRWKQKVLEKSMIPMPSYPQKSRRVDKRSPAIKPVVVQPTYTRVSVPISRSSTSKFRRDYLPYLNFKDLLIPGLDYDIPIEPAKSARKYFYLS